MKNISIQKFICWDGYKSRLSSCTGDICLETIRQDVVGCHGDDGGSCWNTREWTTGPGDVDMGVRQRCVSVDAMLREKSRNEITNYSLHFFQI